MIKNSDFTRTQSLRLQKKVLVLGLLDFGVNKFFKQDSDSRVFALPYYNRCHQNKLGEPKFLEL